MSKLLQVYSASRPRCRPPPARRQRAALVDGSEVREYDSSKLIVGSEVREYDSPKLIVGSELREWVRLPKVNRRARGTRYDSPKLIVSE